MKRSPAQTYQDIARDRIDAEFLRNKLKLKEFEVKKDFSKKYPYVEKFFAKKGIKLGQIRDYSAKILGASALTGTLLLAPPSTAGNLPLPTEIIEGIRKLGKNVSADVPQKLLFDLLAQALPERVRPLERGEEKYLEQLFERIVGIKSRAALEGEHLNTTYGLIGAEQHLKMYPGDGLFNHGPFSGSGMAPGLGAWGYFASSKAELTKSLEETERWYAVVQTLYLPDWNRRQPYLREWYKYRRVLIVNTLNGNAVVAAVADSGPAAWTGKHFGGSPEVMAALGGPDYKKGPVVVFFIDDPENKVPLGPVEYNKLNISKLSLTQI